LFVLLGAVMAVTTHRNRSALEILPTTLMALVMDCLEADTVFALYALTKAFKTSATTYIAKQRRTATLRVSRGLPRDSAQHLLVWFCTHARALTQLHILEDPSQERNHDEIPPGVSLFGGDDPRRTWEEMPSQTERWYVERILKQNKGHMANLTLVPYLWTHRLRALYREQQPRHTHATFTQSCGVSKRRDESLGAFTSLGDALSFLTGAPLLHTLTLDGVERSAFARLAACTVLMGRLHHVSVLRMNDHTCGRDGARVTQTLVSNCNTVGACLGAMPALRTLAVTVDPHLVETEVEDECYAEHCVWTCPALTGFCCGLVPEAVSIAYGASYSVMGWPILRAPALVEYRTDRLARANARALMFHSPRLLSITEDAPHRPEDEPAATTTVSASTAAVGTTRKRPATAWTQLACSRIHTLCLVATPLDVAHCAGMARWRDLANVRLLLAHTVPDAVGLEFLWSHAPFLVDVHITTTEAVVVLPQSSSLSRSLLLSSPSSLRIYAGSTDRAFPRLTRLVLGKGDGAFLSQVRCPLLSVLVFLSPQRDYGSAFDPLRFPALREYMFNVFSCHESFPSHAPVHPTLRHVSVALPAGCAHSNHAFVTVMAHHCPEAVAVLVQTGHWSIVS